MKLLIVTLFLFVASLHILEVTSLSCYMGGRFSCFGSCVAQNCARGHCDNDWYCRCEGCDNGVSPVIKATAGGLATGFGAFAGGKILASETTGKMIEKSMQFVSKFFTG